jgi:hypothetical protein
MQRLEAKENKPEFQLDMLLTEFNKLNKLFQQVLKEIK